MTTALSAEKKCVRCKEVLPLDAFAPHVTATDGRQYACKPCNRAYNRNYYHKRKGDSGEDFTPAYTTIRATGYTKKEIAEYCERYGGKAAQKKFGLSYYQVRTCHQSEYGARDERTRSTSPLVRKLQGMQGKSYVYNCQFVHIQGFEVEDEQVILHTGRRPLPLPLQQLSSILEREFLPMER
jgi:hypothetical protein